MIVLLGTLEDLREMVQSSCDVFGVFTSSKELNELSASSFYLIACIQRGDEFSSHLFESDREGGNHSGHP